MTKQEHRSYKSRVFTAYNKMRALFRRNGWDVKYVNRALGLALSYNKLAEKMLRYNTDYHHCDCKDWEFHYRKVRKGTWPCKHMIALDLIENPSLLTA